jgi:uridine kinase
MSHLSPEESASYNYDRPEALEMELLAADLGRLAAGETATVPVYDFDLHKRLDETVEVHPEPVIVVEGLFILTVAPVFERLDLSIYIDTPADIRFIRRLRRDTAERGKTVERVTDRYLRHCRPMHERYVEPGKSSADLVISGESITPDSLRPVLERMAI